MNKRQDYFSNHLKAKIAKPAEGLDDWRNGYVYFVDAFQDQMPAMRKLFDTWLQCADRHKDIQKRFAAGCPSFEESGTTAEQHASWFNEITHAMDAEYETGAIIAGTILLVMSRGLKGYADYVGVGHSKFKSIGPQVGQTSLLNLIYSAGNNFRHYEDWKAPGSPNEGNEKGLRAAGIDVALDQNVCNQVMALIGFEKAEDINLLFMQILDAILKRKAGPTPWPETIDDFND